MSERIVFQELSELADVGHYDDIGWVDSFEIDIKRIVSIRSGPEVMLKDENIDAVLIVETINCNMFYIYGKEHDLASIQSVYIDERSNEKDDAESWTVVFNSRAYIYFIKQRNTLSNSHFRIYVKYDSKIDLWTVMASSAEKTELIVKCTSKSQADKLARDYSDQIWYEVEHNLL